MKLLAVLTLSISALTTVALAGNTSSNSSSNSSNGVHSRVDTVITDNGRGRTIRERRSIRIDDGRGRSTYTVREREKYGHRAMRRWHDDDD